ncbi:hypothetical protein M413DRAFT_447921 [Hebeloma cylindrosporum]|uniref:Protein kinase domain-containing protein n=1 Tax=Hebeloma cylindrosporum TaxID=76867 RepID=A0A0C3C3K8_HEBCY|nr:hypothetical protein M413DRAFT_447921 [Hebeloma cylindrosporum h7]
MNAQPSETDIRAEPENSNLRRQWWESMQPWFAERGYILNKTTQEEEDAQMNEEPMYTFSGEVRYPYSYTGGCKVCEIGCALSHPPHPRVALAQDSESRHVVIKVLLSDSEEFKVLNFLRQEKILLDRFCGVIPVLDMLSFGAFQFAVLPRWGGRAIFSWFGTSKDVLHYVRCLLQGLVFLHERRIFHRDISEGNILANHFSCSNDCCSFTRTDMRSDLRRADRLDYALNDFDWSLLLPAEASLKDFRIPISGTYPGVYEKPNEALRGEVDFNPFAYDVGCLGIQFAYTLQHLCPSIPLLAPLIDGMVTHHVPDRFTAQEALSFLDEAQLEMTPGQLEERPNLRESITVYDKFDRWSNVPPALVEKWGRYRERSPSYFAIHVIYPLCMRPWGVSLVYRTRTIFRYALFAAKYLFTL